MSARVVGIDVGERTSRIVAGRSARGAFEIHAARAVATAEVPAALAELGLKGARVVVGVTGRDMILRTTLVPPVPEWQLEELMAFEIDDIAEQSGDALSAGFAVMPGAGGYVDEDVVLLALVRDSLIAERQAWLADAKVSISAFAPNAIALFNAVAATDGGDGTVMVASLRGNNTDIALLRDGELLFARNLSGGGRMFTQAIADAFRVDDGKAEQAKHKLGVFARPGERLPEQQARVSQALEGGLRQVTGLLQSSVMLCKGQLKATDLVLDRVLLCGPGAAVPGLDEALTRALDVPVEVFDPTEGYVVGDAPELDEHGPDFAIAAGLAMMGCVEGAYRLEVLPEAEKKRREFLGKTLWLVLAVVLAVAHLGVHAFTAAADHEKATRDERALSAEVRRREQARDRYERAVAAVTELGAELRRLEEVSAPASAALAAMQLFGAHLPDELWLTSFKTVREIEPDFGRGVERRPFVIAAGSGKEQSRPLSDAIVELTTRLRADPGVAGVVTHSTTGGRLGFTFDVSVDTSLFPDRVGGAEADEDDGADDGATAMEAGG